MSKKQEQKDALFCKQVMEAAKNRKDEEDLRNKVRLIITSKGEKLVND